jgi:hypothetical protein
MNHASYIAISVISKLEFLSFAKLSVDDRKVFDTFLSKVTVYDLAADNDELMQEIVKIRQKKALKLPDAIIAAKSHLCQTILVTADKQLISAVSNAYEFSVIKFN